MKLRQGNVFTPACHSVHRGGVCHTPPGRHPRANTTRADTPSADTLPQWADTPPPSSCSDTHPLLSACWDTVNKRVVRILLECILVVYWLGKFSNYRNEGVAILQNGCHVAFSAAKQIKVDWKT